MRILLSAYACEPNRGSEPGVGWNWANELAKLGHEVWVLTRGNNQASIEIELAQRPSELNLHFLYIDLPVWCQKLKKIPGGLYPYYLLWQWMACKLAHHAHSEVRFDCVHHVTFASIRMLSFMGRLKIPFIWGPVAGGEKAPWNLRCNYTLRGFLLDALRDFANLLIPFNILLRNTFQQANYIYVTSIQTKALIPKKYQNKTKVKLAIGLDQKWNSNSCGLEKKFNLFNTKFNILYVGRFLFWKGMHFGINAFSKASRICPNITLTLVGQGDEEKKWKKLVSQLGVMDKVNWVSWVDHSDLSQLYRNHAMFLFPSLHDSGGMVVLEAMAHGLPVVCLKLGGPAVMVDDSCGRCIDVEACDQDEVIEKISKGMLELCQDKDLYESCSKNAFIRAESFRWSHTVNSIYDNLILNDSKNI